MTELSLDALERQAKAAVSHHPRAGMSISAKTVLALIAAARTKSETPEVVDTVKRFKGGQLDGQAKPYLPPEEYDALRGDDKFLYNRITPKPLFKSPDPRPAEAEIPEILARASRGEALSPQEQAAHTGYEIGWRDGRNDALSRPAGEEVAGLVAEAECLERQSFDRPPSREERIGIAKSVRKAAKALSTLSAERDAMEGALTSAMREALSIQFMTKEQVCAGKTLPEVRWEALRAALQQKGETDEQG